MRLTAQRLKEKTGELCVWAVSLAWIYVVFFTHWGERLLTGAGTDDPLDYYLRDHPPVPFENLRGKKFWLGVFVVYSVIWSIAGVYSVIRSTAARFTGGRRSPLEKQLRIQLLDFLSSFIAGYFLFGLLVAVAMLVLQMLVILSWQFAHWSIWK